MKLPEAENPKRDHGPYGGDLEVSNVCNTALSADRGMHITKSHFYNLSGTSGTRE